MCIVVWFSFSLSPHLYLSLFMPVSFFLHMSLYLHRSVSVSLYSSGSLFTCLPVVLGVCGCVCWCVVCVLGCACCCGVCVQNAPVCTFNTFPCVLSKRPCQIGHGRFERTHGILNVHTGASLSCLLAYLSSRVSLPLLSRFSHVSLFLSLSLLVSLSLFPARLFLSFSCRHSKTITSCINYGSYGFN